jgi:hypothetical protein
MEEFRDRVIQELDEMMRDTEHNFAPPDDREGYWDGYRQAIKDLRYQLGLDPGSSLRLWKSPGQRQKLG